MGTRVGAKMELSRKGAGKLCAPFIIARFAHGLPEECDSMTTVEILFRYGMPPDEKQMAALGLTSDVYGIRRILFNELERTIRVEYDATRLNEASVEKLLRSAGFDIRERPA